MNHLPYNLRSTLGRFVASSVPKEEKLEIIRNLQKTVKNLEKHVNRMGMSDSEIIMRTKHRSEYKKKVTDLATKHAAILNTKSPENYIEEAMKKYNNRHGGAHTRRSKSTKKRHTRRV